MANKETEEGSNTNKRLKKEVIQKESKERCNTKKTEDQYIN